MLIGISAGWRAGHTGADHLIDSADEAAMIDAVAGQSFRRAADALKAAETAFYQSCDRRCRTARIVVTLRTSRGDLVEIGQ